MVPMKANAAKDIAISTLTSVPSTKASITMIPISSVVMRSTACRRSGQCFADNDTIGRRNQKHDQRQQYQLNGGLGNCAFNHVPEFL